MTEKNNNECSLVRFARRELEILERKASQIDGDGLEMQKIANHDILEIVEKFSSQGHSGFSAAYVLGAIKRLLDYKPLGPLTGEDDEWGSNYDTIDGDTVYQNNRCSAVFKTVEKSTGRTTCKYIYKYVFSDDGGVTWFNSFGKEKAIGLSREIEFPFVVPEKSEKIYIAVSDHGKYVDEDEMFDVLDEERDRDTIMELRKRRYPEKYRD